MWKKIKHRQFFVGLFLCLLVLSSFFIFFRFQEDISQERNLGSFFSGDQEAFGIEFSNQKTDLFIRNFYSIFLKNFIEENLQSLYLKDSFFHASDVSYCIQDQYKNFETEPIDKIWKKCWGMPNTLVTIMEHKMKYSCQSFRCTIGREFHPIPAFFNFHELRFPKFKLSENFEVSHLGNNVFEMLTCLEDFAIEGNITLSSLKEGLPLHHSPNLLASYKDSPPICIKLQLIIEHNKNGKSEIRVSNATDITFESENFSVNILDTDKKEYFNEELSHLGTYFLRENPLLKKAKLTLYRELMGNYFSDIDKSKLNEKAQVLFINGFNFEKIKSIGKETRMDELIEHSSNILWRYFSESAEEPFSVHYNPFYIRMYDLLRENKLWDELEFNINFNDKEYSRSYFSADRGTMPFILKMKLIDFNLKKKILYKEEFKPILLDAIQDTLYSILGISYDVQIPERIHWKNIDFDKYKFFNEADSTDESRYDDQMKTIISFFTTGNLLANELNEMDRRVKAFNVLNADKKESSESHKSLDELLSSLGTYFFRENPLLKKAKLTLYGELMGNYFSGIDSSKLNEKAQVLFVNGFNFEEIKSVGKETRMDELIEHSSNVLWEYFLESKEKPFSIHYNPFYIRIYDLLRENKLWNELEFSMNFNNKKYFKSYFNENKDTMPFILKMKLIDLNLKKKTFYKKEFKPVLLDAIQDVLYSVLGISYDIKIQERMLWKETDLDKYELFKGADLASLMNENKYDDQGNIIISFFIRGYYLASQLNGMDISRSLLIQYTLFRDSKIFRDSKNFTNSPAFVDWLKKVHLNYIFPLVFKNLNKKMDNLDFSFYMKGDASEDDSNVESECFFEEEPLAYNFKLVAPKNSLRQYLKKIHEERFMGKTFFIKESKSSGDGTNIENKMILLEDNKIHKGDGVFVKFHKPLKVSFEKRKKTVESEKFLRVLGGKRDKKLKKHDFIKIDAPFHFKKKTKHGFMEKFFNLAFSTDSGECSEQFRIRLQENKKNTSEIALSVLQDRDCSSVVQQFFLKAVLSYFLSPFIPIVAILNQSFSLDYKASSGMDDSFSIVRLFLKKYRIVNMCESSKKLVFFIELKPSSSL